MRQGPEVGLSVVTLANGQGLTERVRIQVPLGLWNNCCILVHSASSAWGFGGWPILAQCLSFHLATPRKSTHPSVCSGSRQLSWRWLRPPAAAVRGSMQFCYELTCCIGFNEQFTVFKSGTSSLDLALSILTCRSAACDFSIVFLFSTTRTKKFCGLVTLPWQAKTKHTRAKHPSTGLGAEVSALPQAFPVSRP